MLGWEFALILDIISNEKWTRSQRWIQLISGVQCVQARPGIVIPSELLWTQIKIITMPENCGVRGQARALTTGHPGYPGPGRTKHRQGHEQHPSSGLGARSDVINTRLK